MTEPAWIPPQVGELEVPLEAQRERLELTVEVGETLAAVIVFTVVVLAALGVALLFVL